MSTARLMGRLRDREGLGVAEIEDAPPAGPAAAPRDRRACRPFGVADAMIATAFVAAGIALALEIGRHVREASAGNDKYLKGLQNLDRDLTWVYPVLASLTLGWSVMRLRRPRPPLARTARQPGMAAALAVGVIGAPAVAASAFVAGWGHPYRWVTPLTTAWPKVGPAVALIWLALFVTGRRRSERGWIDGSGRVLGALWIATIFLKAPIGPWYPPDPQKVAADAEAAAWANEFFGGPALLQVPGAPASVPPSPPAPLPEPVIRHEK